MIAPEGEYVYRSQPVDDQFTITRQLTASDTNDAGQTPDAQTPQPTTTTAQPSGDPETNNGGMVRYALAGAAILGLLYWVMR